MSKKNSQAKILKILKEEFDENSPEVFLAHIGSQEEAENMAKEITSIIPEVKITIGEFSPIIGYAMGPGTLGISYFAKQ